MNALLKVLLCTTLAAGLSSAHAEDPTWFEVELLVFSRQDQSNEYWPEQQQLRKNKQGIDLLSPQWLPDLSLYEQALDSCDSFQWLFTPQECEAKKQQVPTVRVPRKVPVEATAPSLGRATEGEPYLLTPDLLQFGSAKDKLNRQRGSKVLLHTGWQMPVYGRRAAQPFILFGGKNFGEQYRLDGQTHPNQPTSEYGFVDALLSKPGQKQAVWELDGWIKVYLNHFLFIESHMDLRLEGEREVPKAPPVAQIEPNSFGLTTPTTEADQGAVVTNELSGEGGALVTAEPETEPFLMTYSLTQKRRVRSREIHYFDHPHLGMVVQIRRMPQPEPKVEETVEVEPTQQEAETNNSSQSAVRPIAPSL